MSGRDRTQDILDVKQRDARWTWFGPYAIESLQRDWQKNRDKPGATPDFYVIRTVTLLEVFTRRNLAATIDHDRTFTDRAIEFSKHVKIDFALVKDTLADGFNLFILRLNVGRRKRVVQKTFLLCVFRAVGDEYARTVAGKLDLVLPSAYHLPKTGLRRRFIDSACYIADLPPSELSHA